MNCCNLWYTWERVQRPAICAGEPLVEIIAELSKDALRKKIYEREFFSMSAESSGRSDLGPYAWSHNSDANGTIALTAQYGLSFNVGLSVR